MTVNQNATDKMCEAYFEWQKKCGNNKSYLLSSNKAAKCTIKAKAANMFSSLSLLFRCAELISPKRNNNKNRNALAPNDESKNIWQNVGNGNQIKLKNIAK